MQDFFPFGLGTWVPSEQHIHFHSALQLSSKDATGWSLSTLTVVIFRDIFPYHILCSDDSTTTREHWKWKSGQPLTYEFVNQRLSAQQRPERSRDITLLLQSIQTFSSLLQQMKPDTGATSDKTRSQRQHTGSNQRWLAFGEILGFKHMHWFSFSKRSHPVSQTMLQTVKEGRVPTLEQRPAPRVPQVLIWALLWGRKKQAT